MALPDRISLPTASADGSPPISECECGYKQLTPLAKTTDLSRGRLRGQPRCSLPGHHRRRRVHYEEVLRDYETPCHASLLWKDKDGYCRVRVGGRTHLAHRAAYEERYGEIPDGTELDHLCGYRDCVNPEHLEAVSHAENIRRGRGTKLKPGDVSQIRSSHDKQGVIAERYGITQGHVSKIRRGASWRDLGAQAA
ncbi:MAG: HNH endonuclease signature motif containing protein [Solirubrobacteraceae bacterium]